MYIKLNKIMTALIKTLDTFTPKQQGENGHLEYGWSNDIREKICQFNFQLTRTTYNMQLIRLKNSFREILTTLVGYIRSSSPCEREQGLSYLKIIYKMIAQTRDIISGKGEYTLTYMMIYELYSFYPTLAFYAIKCLVIFDTDIHDKEEIHQYGSWKDIKYFCHYCYQMGETEKHPLIVYCIKLINEQLIKDESATDSSISLVSKWIPREKSKFGWIYSDLACDYFRHYMDTAKTKQTTIKATRKCMTEYRKLLSRLNAKIDTLQIKQCNKTWSTIDFNKVTSISLTKQKNAFLNKKTDGTQRSEEEDRIICATNFIEHVQKAVKGEKEMKGKRLGMEEFTSQAINILLRSNCNIDQQVEMDLLNSQWRDNSADTPALTKMVAMVDVSGSMDGIPLHAAIALGIRIAEKSALGKRIMTFSATPTWCNLENHTNFVDMVNVIKNASWGMNTNFYAALDLILNAIIETKLSPEEVEGMVLAILSDMQIDSQGNTGMHMYGEIEKKYADTGIRLYGKPFKPPHILFWNLRSTSGFPTLTTQKNSSMMSGLSPALLNLFCEKGVEALESCNPWSILLQSLENPRYKIMENKITDYFMM